MKKIANQPNLLLFSIGIGLLVTLVGLGLAFSRPLFSAVVIGIAAWIGYFSFRSKSFSPFNTDVWFWLVLCLVLLTAQVSKFTGLVFDFSIEMALLAAAPQVVHGGYKWLSDSYTARVWAALFSLFIIESLLSSLLGRSIAVATTFQFFTNLKFVYVIVLGYSLAWSSRTEYAFWGLMKWAWLPFALLLVWQWGHWSSYIDFFPGTHAGLNPITFLPGRAVGPFTHSAVLACYVSIFFIAQYVALRLNRIPFRSSNVISTIIYFLILIASGQRQELLATVVVLVSWEIIRLRALWQALATILGTLVLAVFASLFFLLFERSLLHELGTWGLADAFVSLQNEHPRAALYRHSFNVASQYFPLGSGLGTYGSAGAEKFDYTLYLDLGFYLYPWFKKQDYLMDTYWPAFIAETGWFGSLILLASFVALVVGAAMNLRSATDKRTVVYWSLAFSYVAYFLLLSPTSPAFQDPVLFLIPGVIYGVAARNFSRSSNV